VTYLIGQLAELSGVSIRTLRYYDSRGLLTPSETTEAGYRRYRTPELLRLQQILFYRELGMPLRDIGEILDNPDFDRVTALERHRREISGRIDRLHTLVSTIDRTIAYINGGTEMADKEFFDGLDIEAVLEKQKEYEAEVDAAHDPEVVAESRRRTAKYSKADWEQVLRQMAAILNRIASELEAGTAPDASETQALVSEHFAFINDRFYTCSLEMYGGLGKLYVTDERFTAFFERIHDGLASYVSTAIEIFVEERSQGHRG